MTIIAHARVDEWTVRLRPRLVAECGVRWVESRSTADLVASARGTGGVDPVVVIDLANRPYWGLEGLDALQQTRPSALSLVLDPHRTPDAPVLARELGATLVWPGVVVPPRVAALLARWVAVVADRAPLRWHA